MNSYFDGSVVRVTATFTDAVTGNPVNPTLTTLVVSVNRGTTTTYTGVGLVIQNPSVGVFYADLDTTAQPGTWCVKFLGSGAVQAVLPHWFDVQAQPV